ncbi:MAG: hypothetical protein Q4F13_12845 [Pseudomonadota bacterium]|nr:hypothetical protein [Pseudomonadota bacterium]
MSQPLPSRLSWRLLPAALGLLALVLTTFDASAQSTQRRTRAKKPPAPKVTYADGQTPEQRQRSEERRLRRECQGRPDAGACRGFTR